ncbi:hypothetical protein [Yoonia sp.]|uniref:hypothetical protein n=1 Tax=Yoonia sp. TaxID=2212373 RepID=UPI002E0443DA|nr:hypothetical protein [Yoonia sp.]
MEKTGPKGPSKPMSDKEFDQLVNMIRIQCTRDEICDILNMSDDTLNRRLKERGEKNFAALYKKHSGEGKASLRRAQWKAAQDGNPTMLVWLGKQMLGQRDKKDLDHTSSDGSMTPREIIIRAADAKTSDD